MVIKVQNRIVLALLILSGIFFFPIYGENMFFPAQLAFFLLAGFTILAMHILAHNKLMGLLCSVIGIMVFMSMLFKQAPMKDILETSIIALILFTVYKFIRYAKYKQNILRIVAIPAILNAVLVIIQGLDANSSLMIPVSGVSGFLGNSGITACYLAITAPIIMKYNKNFLPLIISALLITKNLTALVAFSLALLVYYFYCQRKRFKIILVCILILLSAFCVTNRNKVIESAKIKAVSIIGVAAGISKNPILGWGVGSFKYICLDVYRAGDINIAGRKLMEPAVNGLLGNPHNELLHGWWNFGILFPILTILLAKNIIRKFSETKLTSFLILLSGAVCSFTYFLQPPAYLLLVTTLAIYENRED